MATTTLNTGSTKLPHLLNWIKHKASKKDGKHVARAEPETSTNTHEDVPYNSGDTPANTQDVAIKSGELSSSSKETLRDSEVDLNTEDSADTMSSTTCFSGNSIVSDSSYDAAEGSKHPKTSTSSTSFSGIFLSSETSKLMSVSTSHMGSAPSCTPSDKNPATGGFPENAICKHGYQANRCRSCMQLPPLPPGSERVLRELQRQAKHKLRSQSQIFSHVGDTPNCSVQVPIDHMMHGVDLMRRTATSPEHIYEEIPVIHFQDAQSQRDTIRQRHMDIVNSARNNGFNSLTRDKRLSYQPPPIVQRGAQQPLTTMPHQPVNMINNQLQLRSHEFYPENMHSQKLKESNVSNPADRPASRQVSLGNLDFGMAKECDGFLVVPLRDRSNGSSMPKQAPNAMPHQKYWFNNHSGVPQQHNPSHKPIHRHTPFRHSASHPINHTPSDSGFQDGNQVTSNTFKDNSNDLTMRVSRDDTANCDNSVVQEKYSHCKRCKRPHALYHGVTLCHSDVEDMRQELQYLDIAGLDKNKLRGKTSVLDSPSLLQNFARRRSAFAKYIPSQKSDENTDVMDPNSEVAETQCTDNNSTNILMSDAYKRQSMSAESDYFSSNYNTSQSDSHSKTSQEFQPEQTTITNYTTSSDRSNDTFSEYDVAPETHMGVSSQEYNFYLEKVKQNHLIKQEVQRMIKSSESERSDNERNYHSDSNVLQEDSISLTSVTSLSELSAFPTEDSAGFIRSRIHKPVKSSPKNTKRNGHKNQLASPVDTYVFKMQRARKPIRKKRKSNKDIEYYKLPEFSNPPAMKQHTQESRDRSEKSSPLENKITATAKLSLSDAMGENSPKDMDQSGTGTEGADTSKSTDKLSCRVTDFRLADMKRSPSVKDSGKVLYTRSTSGESTGESGNRSSVYSSHTQINKNTNNRLLSDLMRMNHDKQLFSLI